MTYLKMFFSQKSESYDTGYCNERSMIILSMFLSFVVDRHGLLWIDILKESNNLEIEQFSFFVKIIHNKIFIYSMLFYVPNDYFSCSIENMVSIVMYWEQLQHKHNRDNEICIVIPNEFLYSNIADCSLKAHSKSNKVNNLAILTRFLQSVIIWLDNFFISFLFSNKN